MTSRRGGDDKAAVTPGKGVTKPGKPVKPERVPTPEPKPRPAPAPGVPVSDEKLERLKERARKRRAPPSSPGQEDPATD